MRLLNSHDTNSLHEQLQVHVAAWRTLYELHPTGYFRLEQLIPLAQQELRHLYRQHRQRALLHRQTEQGESHEVRMQEPTIVERQLVSKEPRYTEQHKELLRLMRDLLKEHPQQTALQLWVFEPTEVFRQLRLPLHDRQLQLHRPQLVTVVRRGLVQELQEQHPVNVKHRLQLLHAVHKEHQLNHQLPYDIRRQVQLPVVREAGATVRRPRVPHPLRQQNLEQSVCRRTRVAQP